MRRKKEVLKYAPDVDSALHIIERSGTISGHELCYRRERLLLEQIGKVLEILDNSHDEEDTRINLWFTAERGDITDWRTYDDAVEYEEINSLTELTYIGCGKLFSGRCQNIIVRIQRICWSS